MCGFVGVINKDERPLDFGVLSSMNNEIIHRGPDDQGYALFDFKGRYKSINSSRNDLENTFPCGIGFRRLSIQDLTYSGHQPMISEDQNVIIVFNGEIYNAPSLREQLEMTGLEFRGTSDTEVLLNYYTQNGLSKLLDEIVGMFSIFIVDLTHKTSFLIRDHFGIKPLYYNDSENTFLFGSEIKSFLKHPDFHAKLNKEHFAEYLMFRFCAQERTLVQGVKQVKPGHYLEISQNTVIERCYWDVANIIEDPRKSSSDSIESLLKESVKSQLLSDVKVGCQLSGGIDSSLVTVFARKHFNSNMDTFSIVFKDKNYSEEKWIDTVCETTKTRAHKFNLSNDYFWKNLKKASWHLDNPITIPNTLGIFLLAEGAKPHSTVLLSGEGADEVFCGYSRYFDVLNKDHLDRRKFYYNLPFIGKRLVSRFNPNNSLEGFFIESSATAPLKQIKGILKDTKSLDLAIHRREKLFPHKGSLLQRCSVYDLKTYLIDLLNRQDKMMMAHSVENRVPFLDKELVTRALNLDDKEKVDFRFSFLKLSKPSNFTKHILKKIAASVFSHEFVYRSKSGFPIPVREIMFKSDFVEMVENELFPSLEKREVIDMTGVYKMWNNAKESNSSKNLKLLWSIVSFEIWATQFFNE